LCVSLATVLLNEICSDLARLVGSLARRQRANRSAVRLYEEGRVGKSYRFAALQDFSADWTPDMAHDEVPPGWGERIMRRRLEAFVPIVLFAVLVQIMAPIGAFCAVARAVADPEPMGAICSEMADADHHGMPSGGPDDHGKCCAFCAVAHGASAMIDPPLPLFVTLQRQYHRMAWLWAMDTVPTVRIGSNAQARAPPQLS
jgi:hypothetical protein